MKTHDILQKYIESLVKGYSDSLIVVSPAGYGKTETTMTAIKDKGLVEGQHYRYVNNYITPVELYLLLEDINRLDDPKLLILDDVEDTLRNPRAIGLLKGALWAVDGKRKVGWHSGTHRVKNKEIIFNGRIIFLLNQFNKKSPVVNALKDRSLYYEMELTKKEMFNLMIERAKKPYQDIPIEKREEIASYLLKAGGSSDDTTLRLLTRAYQLFQVSPHHWQKLLKKLI